MFRHTRMRKLISSYIDGELTPQEKNVVEDHLAKCAACRAYIKELEATRQTLAAWENEEITPDLEEKIKTNFLGSKYRKGAVMKPRTVSIIRTIGITAAAAMVVITVGIAGGVYLSEDFRAAFTNLSKEVISSPVVSLVVPQLQKSSKAKQWPSKQVAPPPMAQLAYVDYDAPYKMSAQSASSVGPSYGGGTTAAYYCPTGDMGAGDGYYYAAESWAPPAAEFDTEAYNRIYEKGFLVSRDNPLSTFSIDVDTAAYSNIRRFLNGNQMPPEDAVRIEEMINYFSYNYPQPKGDQPFSVTTEVSTAPWNPEHKLALIGIQGEKIATADLPPSNLVFLIDVSGSMDEPNKLPLLKSAFKLLTKELRREDKVSIVVYASATGLILDSTPGDKKAEILLAIDNLVAEGSTAGGEGIQLAYEVAKKNFIKGGNNRVILATDGDFNVGPSSDAEMTRLIEEKRNDNIFLTVLGFGMGNYKDSKMEALADSGNGNAAYIDNLLEAKKVFVTELGSTLFTIAKDVKIQVEFNPGKVKAYRLIGYETRMLDKEDFKDDKKDAGELGAGHSVTVLYEIVTADSPEKFGDVDPLKYQESKVVKSNDLFTLKLRYKDPEGDTSKLITKQVMSDEETDTPSNNFEFAAAVAEFGMILRDSEYKGSSSYDDVLKRARASKGNDPYGYRAEFIKLVEMAQMLDQR